MLYIDIHMRWIIIRQASGGSLYISNDTGHETLKEKIKDIAWDSSDGTWGYGITVLYYNGSEETLYIYDCETRNINEWEYVYDEIIELSTTC
jgi:WD40 repeat protein